MNQPEVDPVDEIVSLDAILVPAEIHPVRPERVPSATKPAEAELGSIARPEERPSPLDRTRATLAYAFFGLFAFEVAAALAVAAFSPASGPVLLQVLDKVIAATAGLAGAASAFYYAQRRD